MTFEDKAGGMDNFVERVAGDFLQEIGELRGVEARSTVKAIYVAFGHHSNPKEPDKDDKINFELAQGVVSGELKLAKVQNPYIFSFFYRDNKNQPFALMMDDPVLDFATQGVKLLHRIYVPACPINLPRSGENWKGLANDTFFIPEHLDRGLGVFSILKKMKQENIVYDWLPGSTQPHLPSS